MTTGFPLICHHQEPRFHLPVARPLLNISIPYLLLLFYILMNIGATPLHSNMARFAIHKDLLPVWPRNIYNMSYTFRARTHRRGNIYVMYIYSQLNREDRPSHLETWAPPSRSQIGGVNTDETSAESCGICVHIAGVTSHHANTARIITTRYAPGAATSAIL